MHLPTSDVEHLHKQPTPLHQTDASLTVQKTTKEQYLGAFLPAGQIPQPSSHPAGICQQLSRAMIGIQGSEHSLTRLPLSRLNLV